MLYGNAALQSQNTRFVSACKKKMRSEPKFLCAVMELTYGFLVRSCFKALRAGGSEAYVKLRRLLAGRNERSGESEG